jgi:hypothetical protein
MSVKKYSKIFFDEGSTTLNLMTPSRTTLIIMTLFSNAGCICWLPFMLIIIVIANHTECRHARCHYTECSNLSCHYAQCHNARRQYVQCRNAGRHYELRIAVNSIFHERDCRTRCGEFYTHVYFNWRHILVLMYLFQLMHGLTFCFYKQSPFFTWRHLNKRHIHALVTHIPNKHYADFDPCSQILN